MHSVIVRYDSAFAETYTKKQQQLNTEVSKRSCRHVFTFVCMNLKNFSSVLQTHDRIKLSCNLRWLQLRMRFLFSPDFTLCIFILVSTEHTHVYDLDASHVTNCHFKQISRPLAIRAEEASLCDQKTALSRDGRFISDSRLRLAQLRLPWAMHVIDKSVVK